jgi:hypothetical protein
MQMASRRCRTGKRVIIADNLFLINEAGEAKRLSVLARVEPARVFT